MSYSTIHLFAAVPAGMAVEIGRNLLRSMYDNIITYQLMEKRYIPAIVINPMEHKASISNIHANSVVYLDDYKESIVFVPILGDIACGSITEAIQEAGEFFPVSSSWIGYGDYFIVRAVGDSMINAGIDDGDLILIRQQRFADDGQIVVALIGDSTTLKRIYHDDKDMKIILRAENPLYEDQLFDDITVQGIAVKVFKSL